MSCITYPLPARNALFRIKALVFQLVVPNSRLPNNLTKRLTHQQVQVIMQRSTFKVLFYVKRQSEKSGQIPVMAVLRSTVRCRSSAANSPFVLLFGIPRQIKQPAKASKPNASTECLRLLRIYRFKLCERFETDPYRYSYRRQRGSLDHRQASEDGYTVPCQTSPRC